MCTVGEGKVYCPEATRANTSPNMSLNRPVRPVRPVRLLCLVRYRLSICTFLAYPHDDPVTCTPSVFFHDRQICQMPERSRIWDLGSLDGRVSI